MYFHIEGLGNSIITTTYNKYHMILLICEVLKMCTTKLIYTKEIESQM